MAYINSIGLAKAPHAHAQNDIYQFIRSMYQIPDEDHEKMARLYDRSEIETRYSVVDDFSLPKNEWTFFEKEGSTTVEKRMKLYFELAPQLGLEAVSNCATANELKKITHLITVSCTGMSAPGLDIQLMQQLQLASDIRRSSINFMGCYAAIHAIKQANDICRSHRHANVLIVDVELCTIHFQNQYSLDNIASSLLFADGAAACRISNEPGMYSIEDFYSEIALDGYKDMAWDISSTGFQMTLSNYIPSLIAKYIEPMLMHSLSNMNISKHDIQHWAIHPGGKKIISEIQHVFSLLPDDVEVSKSVLNDYGNMSSATILFVLERMRQKIVSSNETVYAVAFGPGLTIESMFLKSC